MYISRKKGFGDVLYILTMRNVFWGWFEGSKGEKEVFLEMSAISKCNNEGLGELQKPQSVVRVSPDIPKYEASY